MTDDEKRSVFVQVSGSNQQAVKDYLNYNQHFYSLILLNSQNN